MTIFELVRLKSRRYNSETHRNSFNSPTEIKITIIEEFYRRFEPISTRYSQKKYSLKPFDSEATNQRYLENSKSWSSCVDNLNILNQNPQGTAQKSVITYS